MEILKYHGLDLPIYPTEEVLCLTAEYKSAAFDGLQSFVRLVRTNGKDESLKTRLQSAESVFKKIEEHTGINVINHRWGLCKYSSEKAIFSYTPDTIVPSGYLLVAEVATIQEKGTLPDIEAERLKLIDTLLHNQSFHETSLNPDIHARQVLYGNRVGYDETPALWFVDIEPVFY